MYLLNIYTLDIYTSAPVTISYSYTPILFLILNIYTKLRGRVI